MKDRHYSIKEKCEILESMVFILSHEEALRIATIIDSFIPKSIEALSQALSIISKGRE